MDLTAGLWVGSALVVSVALLFILDRRGALNGQPIWRIVAWLTLPFALACALWLGGWVWLWPAALLVLTWVLGEIRRRKAFEVARARVAAGGPLVRRGVVLRDPDIHVNGLD